MIQFSRFKCSLGTFYLKNAPYSNPFHVTLAALILNTFLFFALRRWRLNSRCSWFWLQQKCAPILQCIGAHSLYGSLIIAYAAAHFQDTLTHNISANFLQDAEKNAQPVFIASLLQTHTSLSVYR